MKQHFADNAISFIALNPLFCRKNSLIAQANHFENLSFHLRFVWDPISESHVKKFKLQR